jgi:crotonobetainyl-CoA:carnitine CoA-transferase CaiB-like acyl-CoA transferase
MLRWDRLGFHKKRARTRYDELVFLHLVGYAGHVMHSGVSGARNIDVLFFMLRLDRFGFHKKHVGTRYDEHVFLHPVGFAGHIVDSRASGVRNVDSIIQAQVGPERIPQKSCWDTLR